MKFNRDAWGVALRWALVWLWLLAAITFAYTAPDHRLGRTGGSTHNKPIHRQRLSSGGRSLQPGGRFRWLATDFNQRTR